MYHVGICLNHAHALLTDFVLDYNAFLFFRFILFGIGSCPIHNTSNDCQPCSDPFYLHMSMRIVVLWLKPSVLIHDSCLCTSTYNVKTKMWDRDKDATIFKDTLPSNCHHCSHWGQGFLGDRFYMLQCGCDVFLMTYAWFSNGRTCLISHSHV